MTEGILLVNKEKNRTSFSIISILRKKTKIKKIGHSGTLDPFATGVMVILIGKNYTKKSDSFISLEKEYIAKIELGKKTSSFDSETPFIAFSKKKPSLKEINDTLLSFQGEILQIPPMYSAKKIDGQKLYKLARKGIEIKREAIKIKVKIDLISYKYPFLDLKIACSKGTYIRSLANDIGKNLGSFGFLLELERTKVGNFKLEDCIDQKDLLSPNFLIKNFIKDDCL